MNCRSRYFKIAVSIIASFFLTIAHSQNQPYRPSNIIPPSPTAASLGKYGDIPVNLFNGTPNIVIPLYDIKTPSHSLAISLHYDATGTRVSQDASWVGLGWALNAGGVITRTIRGQDDFNGHGYFFSQALPPSNPDNTYQFNSGWQNDKFYFDNVLNGQMDPEPDVFSYNFNGFSGRFVLGKNADGGLVFLDDKNNLQIKYLSTTGIWLITTGEGYKYYFSTPDYAQNYYRSGLTELTDLTGVTNFNMDLGNQPITTWHLDSIVAPSAEKISFVYVKGKSLSLVDRSEEYYQMLSASASPNCQPGATCLMTRYQNYIASKQELQDKYLQKINFVNGSIEFNLSNRNDIEFLNNSDPSLKPSKLDNIIIRDSKGAALRQYGFYYSYFHSGFTIDDITARLKLDSIAESGNDGSRKPAYVFRYLNPNSLPDKYTKSMDHWGYYNGIVNSTLLPSTTVPNGNPFFNGGNREPDTIQNFPMNGVLSSIRYPTGGSSVFEYELHDYSNLHGAQFYKTVHRYEFVRANPDINPTGDIVDVVFTVNPNPTDPFATIPVTVECTYQKVDPTVSDLPSLGFSNMWSVDYFGSLKYVAGCTMANYNQPNPSPVFTNYNFAPGNYKMHLQSIKGWSTYMSISWDEKVNLGVTRLKGGVFV